MHLFVHVLVLPPFLCRCQKPSAPSVLLAHFNGTREYWYFYRFSPGQHCGSVCVWTFDIKVRREIALSHFEANLNRINDEHWWSAAPITASPRNSVFASFALNLAIFSTWTYERNEGASRFWNVNDRAAPKTSARINATSKPHLIRGDGHRSGNKEFQIQLYASTLAGWWSLWKTNKIADRFIAFWCILLISGILFVDVMPR